MTIREWLENLKERGISVEVLGTELKIDSANGMLDKQLKEEILSKKQEIIEAHRNEELSDMTRAETDTVTFTDSDDSEFWVRKLQDIPAKTEFPVDIHRSIKPYLGSSQYTIDFDIELVNKLKNFAVTRQIHEFGVLKAALTAFLFRFSGEEDIIFGVAGPLHSNDYTSVAELTDAMYPLRTCVDGSGSFAELLNSTDKEGSECSQRQQIDPSELLRKLAVDEDSTVFPVFQHGVAYLEGFTISKKAQNGVPERAAVDTAWLFTESETGLKLCVEYRNDLFYDETICRYTQNYLTLLDNALDDPGRKIFDLEIISPSEKAMIDAWNDTKTDYKIDRSFQEWLKETFRLQPYRVALIWEGGAFSYAELDKKSDRLAAYLQSNGLKPNDIVGVYTDRNPTMIIGILGIMKAGGAYLPLDPKYPAERKKFMVSDAGLKLILSEQKYRSRLKEYDTEVFCLDAGAETYQNEKHEYTLPKVSDDDLAYVIYTSGSTGTPKGVMATYGNLMHYSAMAIDEYELTSEDRVLQFGTMNFDVFVEEVFPTYLCGASLVLRNEACALGGDGFWSYIEQHQITFITLPTAFWHTLCTQLTVEQVQMGRSCRLLVFGGEAMLTPMLKEWQKYFGDRMRVINSYGPTEATVVVTGFDCESFDVSRGKVPIGTPFKNVQCLIVDEHMNLCPVGVHGELYIQGPQVVKGYLNRPDLTAQRFVPDTITNNPEGKLYRTGDVVRYLPDGNIDFIGRNDFQVKILGHRIELGEIENALNKLEEVREAVVIVREDSPGDKKIVAYFVPKDKDVEISGIRSQLENELAAYMIPAAFVRLSKMPLNSNGKLIRKSLPVPDRSDMVSRDVISKPETEFEKKVLSIWEEVLSVSPISIDDNFFDIGGHSLIAVRLFDEIRDEMGIDLPLAALFEAPTVRKLAEYISQDDEELQSVSASPLVEINGEGILMPFFCIHGHRGNVLNFAPLSRVLGKEQPFYGLQGVGFAGVEQPLTRIEEIAERYVHEIKKVQPAGPYALGGYCFGSLIAVELANRLKARGDEVARLVFIDPQPNLYPELISEDFIQRFESYHREQSTAMHMENLEGVSLLRSAAYILKKLWDKGINTYMNLSIALVDFINKKTGSRIPHLLYEIEHTNDIALKHYKLTESWHGDLDLILSKPASSEYSEDPENEWKALARGEIRKHYINDTGTVAGGDMFRKPYVFETANALKACLSLNVADSLNVGKQVRDKVDLRS